MKTKYFFIILLFVFNACSSNDLDGHKPNNRPEEPKEEPVDPNVPDFGLAYNLNVVYFVPNDVAVPAEHERRISEMMLWLRKFYGDNMNRNGFGDISFGLRMKSETRINLITIDGEKGKASYPYGGGHTEVKKEVDAYFALNPTKKESVHTLIIIPSYLTDKPGGPPFYGVGRNCYALDYADMDIKYLGEASANGTLLTQWFGGMAHELGHGLNLPHNSQLVSQKTNPDLGTTLMGAGNMTLGKSPTFLSKASCAILKNCEVFSKVEKPFYKTNGTLEIEAYTIKHTATAINIAGKYKNASMPINAVNVYVDDFPYAGVNDNYDAESWSITNLTDNKFTLEIPLSELGTDKVDDKFRVRILFLFDNGTFVEESRDFDRTDLKDYTFENIAKVELSTAGWEATASSSAVANPPNLLLDLDPGTLWHSQWDVPKQNYPHVITVDMQGSVEADGVLFVQREVKPVNTFKGTINEIKLEVSVDGTNWEVIGLYNLNKSPTKQFISFSGTKTIKKFKITAISGHFAPDPEVAGLAEIGLFKNL